jgi:hypothetical protein
MGQCGKMRALGHRLLAVFLLGSAALAAAGSPPRDQALEQARQVVEEVRHRTFLRPVPESAIDSSRLRSVLEQKFAEGLPIALPEYFRCLSALGALDPADLPGLSARLFAFYESQVLAFYDPSSRQFFVSEAARDKLGALGPTEMSLLFTHELTHALQDQYLSLDERLRALRDNGDAAMALDSLLEGEATEVMIEGALRDLPGADDQINALLGPLLTSSAADLAPDSKSVPAFFVQQLFFPYTDGTAFVRERKKRGGWAAIDALWRRPPTSTSEILHGSLSWAPAEGLLPPAADVATPKGSKRLYADTLGEWTLRFLFRKANVPEADAVAAAWRGDRFLFFDSGSAILFTGRIQAADDASARRIAQAFSQVRPGIRAEARGRLVTVESAGD